MKTIFKKNQIIITALAIMIAVVGYLNFAKDKEDEADKESALTAAKRLYLFPARRLPPLLTAFDPPLCLSFPRLFFQGMAVVSDSTVADELKQDAIDQIIALTARAENENAAEILLEAKGYEGVVVSISDTEVDVVVNAESVTEQQIAQIGYFL